MIKLVFKYFLLPSLFFFTFNVIAQKRVERIKYQADRLIELKVDGKKVRQLIKNVKFQQKGVIMFCDSALFYVKENRMDAFDNVKIIEDSVTITSNRLIYDGINRQAKLRDNVIYTKGGQKLTTDFLDYDTRNEVGRYYNNGTLKDSVNTLSSKTGIFYSKENYALFTNQVELIAPSYTLKTDTLRYNTLSKIVLTKGKTSVITENKSQLFSDGGKFETISDRSQVMEGTVHTENYTLTANELFSNKKRELYNATGNVVLVDKSQDVIILGDEGFSNQKTGVSKVYGNAVMKRILKNDTLYLSSDTLVFIDSSYDSTRKILAYNNVKVWQQNVQGRADSASYQVSDSTFYFYEDPIFWNQKNQISSDTISLFIQKKQLKEMHLFQHAFMIAEEKLQKHNQIKGREMKVHFKDSIISHIEVNGNGESIYYMIDEQDSLHLTTMGMNRIICSNMMIRFENQKLSNISFYVNPEAQFIPPHELTEDIQKLDGYQWRISERPKRHELLTPSSNSKESSKKNTLLKTSPNYDASQKKMPQELDRFSLPPNRSKANPNELRK